VIWLPQIRGTNPISIFQKEDNPVLTALWWKYWFFLSLKQIVVMGWAASFYMILREYEFKKIEHPESIGGARLLTIFGQIKQNLHIDMVKSTSFPSHPINEEPSPASKEFYNFHSRRLSNWCRKKTLTVPWCLSRKEVIFWMELLPWKWLFTAHWSPRRQLIPQLGARARSFLSRLSPVGHRWIRCIIHYFPFSDFGPKRFFRTVSEGSVNHKWKYALDPK